MQRKHKGSPTSKTAKVQKVAGTVMATVFWDRDGILLIEFMVKGQAVIGTTYGKKFENLPQAIVEKRRKGEKRRISLPPRNAPSHTSCIARAPNHEQGMTKFFQIPYSPDLEPS